MGTCCKRNRDAAGTAAAERDAATTSATAEVTRAVKLQVIQKPPTPKPRQAEPKRFLVVGGLVRKQQGKGYNYSQLHPDRYTQTPLEAKDYLHSVIRLSFS